MDQTSKTETVTWDNVVIVRIMPSWTRSLSQKWFSHSFILLNILIRAYKLLTAPEIYRLNQRFNGVVRMLQVRIVLSPYWNSWGRPFVLLVLKALVIKKRKSKEKRMKPPLCVAEFVLNKDTGKVAGLVSDFSVLVPGVMAVGSALLHPPVCQGWIVLFSLQKPLLPSLAGQAAPPKTQPDPNTRQSSPQEQFWAVSCNSKETAVAQDIFF